MWAVRGAAFDAVLGLIRGAHPLSALRRLQEPHSCRRQKVHICDLKESNCHAMIPSDVRVFVRGEIPALICLYLHLE